MINIKKIKALKPGMVVAKDIYTPSDELIVANNTVLTARGIKRLESYNLKEIPIIIIEASAKNNEPIKTNYTASEKMKQSVSFKKFYKAFDESVKVSEKVINEIALRGGEINEKLINTMVDRVVDVSNNGIFIFDMLHCMRELDDLTYAHSMSVALICKVFGEWLRMPKEEVNSLKVAGFCHDIGKVKVPKEIICKKGKLTQVEYEIVKKHTEFGYDILRNKKVEDRVIMTALMHHERCDGSGYPNKLKSNHIDEFAKIVAIADSYEAMTATRCYREAICPFTVIEEFEANALNHYEPKYILPLMEMIVQSYIGNNVELNNGVVGEVIMINRHNLSRPVIKTETEYIDLSKTKKLKIKSVL
ncbi:putative nucleotidyltransferase with HDIG domain [Lachnotalea glycerini]|uniref:Putative nucleotidyltransferase with HDIG domain n=1 Tax=Lachnotalea glycerini TaxID=1763509 RepID=A0A318EI26_9FIRM|nr:HD-GYP domain-containing protein [Lachnotalea glycerini]PXV84913.1 putative nucleotidyltransferase with HDIG domain [Lachnotalea glycerini]